MEKKHNYKLRIGFSLPSNSVTILIWKEIFKLKLNSYPRKYAFFVSQKSLVPTCGSISFCKISRAYLILFSLVTPGLAPRDPMKFKATFCSCTTKASSSEGFTYILKRYD